VQQRVVSLVGFQFLLAHITGWYVGTRMAAKAHHPKVEESWLAAAAHIVRRFTHHLKRIVDVEAVSFEIFKSRPL
jgi:hypothetical protein